MKEGIFPQFRSGIEKSGFWYEQMKQHMANGGSVVFVNMEYTSKQYIERIEAAL
jgi:hypothetical protein